MTMRSETPYRVGDASTDKPSRISLINKFGNETPYETPLRPPIFRQGVSSEGHISIGFLGMRPLETPYIYIKSIYEENRAYRGSYTHTYKVLKHTGSQGLRVSPPHLWRMR